MEKLAINGGKPVRTKPFPPHFLGANLIGKEEKALVNKVIDAKSLFRHYGANSSTSGI
jgi:8-amino-3,8-dideoxy-alpha-D-manno-octulosonate transaminase